MDKLYSIEDEDGETLVLDGLAGGDGLVFLYAMPNAGFAKRGNVVIGALPVTAIIEGLKEVAGREALEDALIENGLGVTNPALSRNRNRLINHINDLDAIIRNKNVQIAQLESDVREFDAEVKSLDAVVADLTEQINLVAEEDEPEAPHLTAEDYAKASLVRHPEYGLMVREQYRGDYKWGNPDFIMSDEEMAEAGAEILHEIP